MSYKILGQQAPPATTLTDLYTVPAGKSAVVNVYVCNRAGGGSSGLFRIAVCPAGAAISDQHYLYYDKSVAGSDSTVVKGIVMGETDVIRVYSSTNNLSFNANGVEQ